MASNEARKHTGSCHCGAVRFEVQLDATAGSRCNCTVCTKVGALSAIVKPDAFRLLTDERSLSFYEWAGKTAKRYFCKDCGVSCYSRGYLEQIGGDYVSVKLACLDDVDPKELCEAPVNFANGRDNKWWEPPAETRHL